MIKMEIPMVAMETDCEISDLEFSEDNFLTKRRNSESLIWKEFFGSSVDLTPSLLSMYDHLNTTTNGSQSENSLQNTGNSNNDLHGEGQIDNYNETNVKLLAQEELRSRDMEDSVDSSRVLSVGQKRPLSIGSTSSSSSTSLPTYGSHKRPNLGECEMTSNHSNKPTLLSLANSNNTSLDSLSVGEDWTMVNAQEADQSDHYYETIRVPAGGPPAVRVYSPQNSTGSADENSLNSSTDDKGDSSPSSQPLQSTYSLKLSNNNAKAPFSSSNSVPRLSDSNLAQSGVLSKDAKYYVSYAQRVTSEIVETEKSYVHSLGEIIEGYMKHIRLCDRIAEAEANQLFGNLEEIYAFNRNLLAELDECGEDPVEVARCFVENNEGFHIYTQYCTDYPDSMEVLTKCMMQPSLAEKFKSWQAALGHGLPLGAFLLKPVQRILKYHLLLQNIVKHYESDQPGYDTLTTALDQMTHLAHHINEMKRRHEHAVRVQEVQSQMEDYDGPNLSTLGELKLEGCFRLLGAKASRSVFLFEKGILITKRKEDGMFSCKAVIVCSNLMLVESIAKEPLSFHVIPFDNTKLQYTLQARTLEMKRKWCQEVKRLILESYMGKIPDKVKSLVMGLGKTRAEVEEELGNHNYNLGVESHDKKPRRKSANLMDLVKIKKGHRKNETTPPKLAPMDQSQQANVRNSSSRLQVKQSNKSMSGSRSMDNLSLSGSHTIPRAKLSSNSSDSPSSLNQNGHADPNLANHFTFVESSGDRNQNGQVSRAKSFKIATRAHPMASISLSENEESTDSESTDEDNHLDNLDEDDVYVNLMRNNNLDTNDEHSGMGFGTRGVSMPALNADIDEPDYVTVMMKPKEDDSVSSNSQPTVLDNDRTAGAFDTVTAEDMIADNHLIYQSVEFTKERLLSKSNSSSYDNLNKRWSNTSSNAEVEGHISPVLPPPCQFADDQCEPVSQTSDHVTCADTENTAFENPWVKQTPENIEGHGDQSVKCAHRKRANVLGKSYSFPLGDVDIGRCVSQESFDWFVYSNKLTSDLSEKFCKLKMWDKLNKTRHSAPAKYPGYVVDKEDSFTLQQRKTIVRYGTPPRNALTTEKVNQFNAKQKKEGPISKKNKPKPVKLVKTHVPLSTAQLWGNKDTGLRKYSKPDKSKDKSRKVAYISDSKKMLEEMENYSDNSSVYSSCSSLNKFPSSSTLTSQKSTEEKFRLPTDFPQNKSSDSRSVTSRDSVYSGNFMSKSRDSLSSSTSSLNKVGNIPKVSSGTQNGAQDSFVGSLRTKLSHLTARLTARKQTPNINSTFNPPAQGQYTATFNARYKPQSPAKPEGFVSHLARIYNSRDQTSPQRSSPKRVTTTPERITNYASVLRKRQLGSPALGSRLATQTTQLQPKVRSLPRQLTGPSCGTSDTETCSETTSVHSLDFSKDKSPDRNSNIEFVSNNIEQSDSALSIHSHVSSVDAPLSQSSKRRNSCGSVNSVGSTDSIYERQFSRNIEDAEDNVFRDSAVYSDMDTGYFFTAPKSLPPTPRKSIREVVQQIEERSRPKQPEVIDVRRREPGRSIQEKVKSLQESSQYPHRSHNFDDHVDASRPLKEFRRSLGSSRSSVDREEASYSIRYSRGHSGHDEGVKMSRSTGRLDQIDNEVNTLTTMKGWVRQLINKFQTDQ